MQISGSIRELRGIMDRAWAIHAAALYFVFPNHVAAVPPSGEYSYFCTTLFFSHSAMLSRDAMLNIRKFLKRAYGQRNRHPTSPFYNLMFDTITITDTFVKFDQNNDFVFEMETVFSPAEQASPILEKIEGMGQTSIDLRRPYLKLTMGLINEWYRNLTTYATKQNYGVNERWIINTLHVEEGQLICDRSAPPPGMHYTHLETPPSSAHDTGFTIMQDHAHATFYLYDLDIIELHRLSRLKTIDTVVLIPFHRFYLLEAHDESLVFKCHTRLRMEKTEISLIGYK